MIKMPSHIETIVSTYKTLSKIPSVLSGKLIKNGSKITSKWSVRNLDKGKNTKYLYNYVLNDNFNRIAESEFGIDVSNELLSAISPRETFKAVIREEKEKDSKKQYLEVWQKNSIVHSIDLTSLDIHGDVYADGEFGCLNWSQDESALAYVAEKKLVKSEPYIKRKGDNKPQNDGSGENAPKKGEEYLYRQDWGEQLVGKYMSVIVVCTLSTETCTVLEGLPEGWCPGQVRFSPDGQSIVGVAWETLPRRLGLIFCTNRPSYIFSLSLDGVMKKISKEGFAVRSPRFSPTGDLFWLQRTTGGPHHACQSLVTVKKGQNEVTTVIDVVQDEMKISNGETFYGLYCLGLPAHCFSADNKRLILSTPQQNEIRTYAVDIDGSRIVDISNKLMPCSTTVLDVKSDIILAACSNLTTPSQLYIGRLPSAGSESNIQWVQVSETRQLTALSTATVDYMTLTHEGSSDPLKTFTALYFAPKVANKMPLIVWPHGGPHSSFVNAFSIEAALFNMLGFACLQVNYRGSTGTGQASVEFLPKRIGAADVEDCKHATDEAIKKYPIDSQKVCLTGGSHGGFLVTHLSGQYPDTYKAVVTRNPVTDVASMLNSTDIPDCPELSVGLATVRVNYRGSTGSGESYVRCLLGNAGIYDTNDCLLALTTLLERDSSIRKDCILLYGGSYGGFVAGHLAGLYPDIFRAMVMRNPLIDLATKGLYADNSDGCEVEAGFEYTEKGAVSEERLLAMRRASPLAHVHKVKAPTCLMLGSGDRRVPHHQGLHYVNRLAANGVLTRVYMYEDNHSLSSLPAEMDNLINGAAWFMEHL